VRTGVTVILPHEGEVWEESLFAGCHRLNGNGELTGLEWVRESGMLTSVIGLTSTHSVGVVHDALIAHEVAVSGDDHLFWALPVVGETWDGNLNDINGFHVKPEHVARALAAAEGGPVPEGSVGGGTGMICHGFKGGIGTASRVVPAERGGFTVGVLVQANHRRRARFQVNGVPVGQVIGAGEVPLPRDPNERELRAWWPERRLGTQPRASRSRMASLMRRSSSTWAELSWSNTWRRTSSTWAGAALASAWSPLAVSTAKVPRPSLGQLCLRTMPSRSSLATACERRLRENSVHEASSLMRSRWPSASDSRTRIS
jgi:hypothetical protein